jgi:hypothetical protein
MLLPREEDLLFLPLGAFFFGSRATTLLGFFAMFDLALGVASAEGLAGLHEELLAFKILLAQLKKKYFAN